MGRSGATAAPVWRNQGMDNAASAPARFAHRRSLVLRVHRCARPGFRAGLYPRSPRFVRHDAPAALLPDGAGGFYGTCASGGTADLGVLFTYSLSSGLQILANFTGANGSYPRGAVISDGMGHL